MRYGSVCSGIEAATQAWHQLGWGPAFFSEIEKFPSAVLAHHYGSNMPGDPLATNGVPNLGDMTKFKEWPDYAIDLLVGGTPCQSFSVAGLRKGLADPRGNLMLTYLALLDRYRPRWCVWENVPGVLSSNKGRDFGAFLGGLGELGYGFAYRVLDAQFVRTCRFPRAVPQRRRRVFVVGYLGDWRRAAAVLFDAESLRGNPPPSREAGQRPAGTTAASVASCLNAAFGDKQGLEDQHINQGEPLFVAHTLRGEGFDASEDGTGRSTPLVPVAFDCKGTEVQVATDGSHPTLRSMGRNHSHQNAGGHAAVAFTTSGYGAEVGDVASTMQASFDRISNQVYGCIQPPWAVRRLTPTECHRLQGFPDDFCNIPWRGKNGAPDGPQYKALGNSMAVNVMEWIGRRIAMVECLIESRAIMEAAE